MIGRLSLIVVAGMAAVALVSALAAPAASDAKRLTVKTDPGHKIKLRRAGREVDYLRRGRHTITIRDTSRSHNVALTRWDRHLEPDSRKALTTFAFVGTKTVTVLLRPGRYSVSCLRHSLPCPFDNCIDRGMIDPFLVD